jgi:phosphopantothenoylcysteine decarboxylase/phosphopantothenate--cysteine ligase
MKKILHKKRVLITAGPTREYLDPVRYISNDSSGKMGFALADVAKKMGADVVLITGPVQLKTPPGVKRIDITSARQMHSEAVLAAKNSDIIIAAAAVADFRPTKTAINKIKDKELTIKMTKNPDILFEIGKIKRPNQLLIGFALETKNLTKNALKKMTEKNCDYIVANHSNVIAQTKSTVTIISKHGPSIKIEDKTKTFIARKILSL